MLLGIAFDGADSPQGGCTTHLASLLFLEVCREGLQVYDYPWLVRLNPSVPHKTRGNGALVLWLLVDTRREAEKLYLRALRVLKEYSRATGSESKAAIASLLVEEERLETRPWPLLTLYRLAVHRYVPREVALRYSTLAAQHSPLLKTAGGGVTGVLAALGADLGYDNTFELLFYMPPELWGNRPVIDEDVVKNISYRLGPFDIATFDYQNNKPLIQPHGPDPVLAGVRSDSDVHLINAASLIPGEFYTHAVLFRTNQHTDAHLAPCRASEAYPYTCCILEGILTELQELPGGHLIGQLCDRTGCVSVAFYRETGVLRQKARSYLRRSIAVAGCIRPHRGRVTVNVEKIIDYENGVTHEPPASAWHHLYMPFARYQRIIRPRGYRRAREPCKAIITP